LTISSRKRDLLEVSGSGRRRRAVRRRAGSLLHLVRHCVRAVRALGLAVLLCALGLASHAAPASIGGPLRAAEANAEEPPPLQEPSGGAAELEASSLPARRRAPLRALPIPRSTAVLVAADRVRDAANALRVRAVRSSTARAPLRC
jgi:hypothetical protein